MSGVRAECGGVVVHGLCARWYGLFGRVRALDLVGLEKK